MKDWYFGLKIVFRLSKIGNMPITTSSVELNGFPQIDVSPNIGAVVGVSMTICIISNFHSNHSFWCIGILLMVQEKRR